MDRQIHKRRLQLQGFQEGEINMALRRVDMYAEYNSQHPGFFDAFISTSMITVMKKAFTKSLFSLQIVLKMVMSSCATWSSVTSV